MSFSDGFTVTDMRSAHPSCYQGSRTGSDLDGLTVSLNLRPVRITRHSDCLTMPAISSLPIAHHVPVTRLALASCDPRATWRL